MGVLVSHKVQKKREFCHRVNVRKAILQYVCADVPSYFLIQKSMATLGTDTKLFSCIGLLVSLQVTKLSERHATPQARKNLLSCVGLLMCSKGTRLREILVTQETGEGLLSGVSPLVGL